ncbi:hypothetical protein BKA56DRAFT_622190 [Ilyonectria sp. MPI-CAGE-AT-0026]|nr:hypothetical protein BKA56DRAFT_622190 [Ilyonectria sp. MPI-CAGE-AT-0026]
MNADVNSECSSSIADSSCIHAFIESGWAGFNIVVTQPWNPCHKSHCNPYMQATQSRDRFALNENEVRYLLTNSLDTDYICVAWMWLVRAALGILRAKGMLADLWTIKADYGRLWPIITLDHCRSASFKSSMESFNQCRRGITIFDRVLRFYRTFDVIAALPAIVSSVIMIFSGVQGHQKTAIIQIAAALLASSVVKSLIAITLAKMLLFRLEGHQHSTERESAILWIPTILVDISIIEVLAGLVFWIADSYPIWVTLLIGVEALALLVGLIALAWKMWAEGLALQPSNLDKSGA